MIRSSKEKISLRSKRPPNKGESLKRTFHSSSLNGLRASSSSSANGLSSSSANGLSSSAGSFAADVFLTPPTEEDEARDESPAPGGAEGREEEAPGGAEAREEEEEEEEDLATEDVALSTGVEVRGLCWTATFGAEEDAAGCRDDAAVEDAGGFDDADLAPLEDSLAPLEDALTPAPEDDPAFPPLEPAELRSVAFGFGDGVLLLAEGGVTSLGESPPVGVLDRIVDKLMEEMPFSKLETEGERDESGMIVT